MKNLLSILCLLLGACVQSQPADLAIRGATVVHVTDGSLAPDQTVLIKGNRITMVGPANEVRVPDSANVIDAAGGYLIPGLWDMHVHSATSVDWHFPLFLVHGVTSVRNMHSTVEDPLEFTTAIKRRLAEGELLGPRFLANGGVVDGEPPVWPGSVVVRTTEEARDTVDSLVNAGADFIKVYDNLSREAYFALMDQARRRGIPVDGHLPFQVRPEEAAAAGQRTVEHTTGITMGCSTKADALRAEHLRLLEKIPTMPPYPDAMIAFFTLVREAMDTRDPNACAGTVRAYREENVAVVPTLVSGHNAGAILDDPAHMRLLPKVVGDKWRAMANAGDNPLEALMGPTYPIIVENVRLLDASDVTILAGTDVGNPFLVPGFSLHQELLLLSEAGLTPLKALQAATLNPARVLGVAASLGTVEASKLADLVLLDANPLEDISNTQRIRAVVADGRLYRRADLDRLLAEVEPPHQQGDEQE